MRARFARLVGVTAMVLVLVVCSVSLAGAGRTAGPAGPGPVDLLPDMRMAPLYGMGIATTTNGRKHLRFGTIGWNVGDGAIELRGKRLDPNDDYMQMRQRIYRSDGSYRERTTSTVAIFEIGDHHHHWHIRQFMLVQLYKPGDTDGDVYGLRKIGYCLLDAVQMGNPPQGSPASPVYPLTACGNPGSQKLKIGLSVGYGDDYPPNFAHQWMDITGLAKGVYRICTTVDPLEEYTEKDESNNQRWTDVRINLASNKAKVLATAVGACGPNGG